MSKVKLIQDLLASKTDEEIQDLIKDWMSLCSRGVLPPNSKYSELGRFISETLNMSYSIELTFKFLSDEVLKRFLRDHP